MNQLLAIVDDKIVIEKLAVKYLDGNTSLVGQMAIKGGLTVVQDSVFDSNLRVRGTVTVDTIKVKNLIREDGNKLDAFTFSAEKEDGLDDKGLVWGLIDNSTQYQLVFRSEPRRIYSSETIDINKNAKYQIDGMDVLTRSSLGSVIKTSSLTKLGILEGLEVDGNANLGNTVIVNSYLNRVGINTEKPNGAFSVVENGVELAIGEIDGRAYIGTWANQGLDIVTDNTTRINIQGNTVTFGSEKSKSAVVKINGQLVVDSIVADVRVERTAPIEFLEDTNSGVYGKGLSWKSKSSPVKTFFLVSGPDRFYSTETIGLAEGKSFNIGRDAVLTAQVLGASVKESSLETVGILRSLTVAGETNLGDALVVSNNIATANRTLNVASGDITLSLTGDSISASSNFKLSVNGLQELAFNENTISIGHKNNTARTINAYGKLSVNITHPDPEAAFSVDGPVVMNGKKFVTMDSMPTYGQWNVGDIAWNSTPQSSGHVGWICIAAGTPGVWRPFGQIA